MGTVVFRILTSVVSYIFPIYENINFILHGGAESLKNKIYMVLALLFVIDTNVF